jgi:hypothetical protein
VFAGKTGTSIAPEALLKEFRQKWTVPRAHVTSRRCWQEHETVAGWQRESCLPAAVELELNARSFPISLSLRFDGIMESSTQTSNIPNMVFDGQTISVWMHASSSACHNHTPSCLRRQSHDTVAILIHGTR